MFRITICSLSQPQIPTFFSKYEEICRKYWQKFICALGESTPLPQRQWALASSSRSEASQQNVFFMGWGLSDPRPTPTWRTRVDPPVAAVRGSNRCSRTCTNHQHTVWAESRSSHGNCALFWVITQRPLKMGPTGCPET